MRTLLRNIPNLLSGYRLLAVPVIGWALYTEQRPLFVWLICISLVTDVLDGLIARLFKLQTAFGAKLDSLADLGTYLIAIAGFIVLEPAFVETMRVPFFLLPVFYALPLVAGLIRFGRLASLHLYSGKITGYLQGIFIFTYFAYGYSPVYFWIMWGFSVLSYAEELVIILRTDELRSNVKGIFWMEKAKGSRT